MAYCYLQMQSLSTQAGATVQSAMTVFSEAVFGDLFCLSYALFIILGAIKVSSITAAVYYTLLCDNNYYYATIYSSLLLLNLRYISVDPKAGTNSLLSLCPPKKYGNISVLKNSDIRIIHPNISSLFKLPVVFLQRLD